MSKGKTTERSEVLQGTLDLLITKGGRKQLEREDWERIAGVSGRLLSREGQK
jgi:hypothetical protein